MGPIKIKGPKSRNKNTIKIVKELQREQKEVKRQRFSLYFSVGVKIKTKVSSYRYQPFVIVHNNLKTISHDKTHKILPNTFSYA